ncbi:hypothetical protein UT300012_22410 [Paraclostridium bifermentans]
MSKLRNEVTNYINLNLSILTPLHFSEDEKATVVNRILAKINKYSENEKLIKRTLHKHAVMAIEEMVELKKRVSNM